MSKTRLGKHHKSPSQNHLQQSNTHSPKPSLRAKAFLVDMFMIGMPIAYLVIYVIMGGGKGFEAQKLLGWGLIFLIHAPIIISLWILNSQTPGMKAYELRLVSISNAQSKPTFAKIILRYFLTPLSILSIIGVLLPFIRGDKLALHDIISGTKIIRQTII